MKRRWLFTLGAVLAAVAAAASSISTAAPKSAHRARACGDIPVHYASLKEFHTFAKAYALLDSPNFQSFKETAFSGFGHTFSHSLPQRKLAAQLAIYGYDFIGTHRGYLLFYRRPQGSWQPGSPPQLTAPNGELLPPIPLPQDLNPEWPAPGLLVTQAPFVGAIVLPQQIIAIPCSL